jgi:hypothetical protein
MDLILWVIVGAVAVGLLFIGLLSVVGWYANKFFGRNEAWLDYGIDEDDLL